MAENKTGNERTPAGWQSCRDGKGAETVCMDHHGEVKGTLTSGNGRQKTSANRHTGKSLEVEGDSLPKIKSFIFFPNYELKAV